MFRRIFSRLFSSLTATVLFWVTIIAGGTFLAVVTVSTLVAERVAIQQIRTASQAAAEGVAMEIAAASNPIELVQQPQWSSKLVGRLSLSPGWRGIQIEVKSGEQSTTLAASPSTPPPQTLIPFDVVPLGEHRFSISADTMELVVRREVVEGQVSIRVFASTEEIHSVLNVIDRNAAWMGSAAWVILVVIVAWLIRRIVTRPLREIAGRMGEVAEGRLDQRIDVLGASEISPLIQSFNLMSNELADTERERTKLLEEVGELNRRLQFRVEAATAALAKAQESLARRDRLAAMGELVGTIAHEVGTPLNSVLAHLDLLAEDMPEGDENAQRLQVVAREIERVSDVIRRYLRSTRPPEPRPATVNLDSFLRDVVRVFEAQALSSGIAFDCQADPVSFETDPDFLTQVVRNLVSNALAAVDTGGQVLVTARLANGRLILAVNDTGIGMDWETQQRVFEPFFTARRDNSGTGLGMSVVRHAVGVLRGRISVASQPGKGTAVVVEVPPMSSAEDPATAVAATVLDEEPA